MSAASKYASQWKGNGSQSDLREEDPTHLVTAKDLFGQLTLLGELTFDRRIIEARKLIGDVCAERGLTDGSGRWRKGLRPSDELPSPDYAAAVDRHLSQNVSRSEAFARVAVRYQVPASSFPAAMKVVERAWRKSGQVGGPEKSNLDRSGDPRSPRTS